MMLLDKKLMNRNCYLEDMLTCAKHMAGDKNKLMLVTEECLQLIKYIGSKIEEDEIIKYE
jgi:uncharacterized protein YaeQ